MVDCLVIWVYLKQVVLWMDQSYFVNFKLDLFETQLVGTFLGDQCIHTLYMGFMYVYFGIYSYAKQCILVPYGVPTWQLGLYCITKLCAAKEMCNIYYLWVSRF